MNKQIIISLINKEIERLDAKETNYPDRMRKEELEKAKEEIQWQ